MDDRIVRRLICLMLVSISMYETEVTATILLQNVTDLKNCRKFCEAIQWVPYDESFSTERVEVDRFKRSVGDLDHEAFMNPPLRLALSAARYNMTKIKNLLLLYKDIPLDSDEVALIMAYTDENTGGNSEIAFYQDLNADCRENGLTAGKYPVAKAILRYALIKIHKKRPLSLQVLYRREPPLMMDQYVETINTNKKMALKQFTSTSAVQGVFPSPPHYIYTHFVQAEVGVSVKAFSRFPREEEVLLPPFYGGYAVRSLSYVAQKAVLSGPSSDVPPAIPTVRTSTATAPKSTTTHAPKASNQNCRCASSAATPDIHVLYLLVFFITGYYI